ncbi:leucine-rich repeat protein [Bacteroides nordii]|uniref:leucine-rich repeat protein n=1 Tax=Bacteroides nordii TaxID=291645 RepID=UPI0034A18E87
MKRFNLYVAILLMCLLGTCSMVKAETIKVTQAGTLYSLVGNKLKTMTELIVTGPLNGDDIACIRDMEALEILNMKGASIVSGGGPYYGQLTTQNNIVGDKMFFGLSQLKKIIFPANVTTIGEDSDSGGGPDYNYGSYAVARCINLEEVEFPTALEKIGAKAFERCIRLKKVALPEGVEYLCSYAFMNCDALTSVSIPSTLSYSSSSSNGYTFWGCDNLTEVSLAEGITELNFGMFQRCKSLISIKLPQSLTKINNAFVDCSGLTSINIPNKVTSTGDFSGCSSLTTVVIPEGVTSIGSFANCTNLTSITLPSTLTSFGSFSNCTSLESIELPDAITELPDYPYAFQGCTKLKSIKLPQKLNIINGHAFEGCSSLATIELPNRVTTLGAYAFLTCSSLETVEIPGNVLAIEYNAFANCGIKHLVLGEGISKINDNVFNNCAQLSTIQFPSTMVHISGFSNTGLTEINFPGSVQKIGTNAFSNCKNLTKIDLSKCAALDSIYNQAFLECKSLETVILPQGLKGLGKSAFEECNKLKYLTLSSTLDTIHTRTFYNCDSLRTVIIPEGVKRINASAFYSCDSLTTLTLPSTLEDLGADVFAEAGLTKVTIPEGITTLPAGAFRECRKLESVILPSTLTKIEARENGWDSGAFYNCISLKTINFPQALTSIPSYTFYGNSLESIELPGVTEIANYAFQGCSKLEHVIFSSKLTTIGANAFNGCAFTSLELPASLKTIGEQAFYNYNVQRINTVIWNSSSEIPRNVFSSITYLFVPNGITGSNVGADNIIRNGLTDSFEAKTESKYIDNRTIFYYEIPKAFKAKKAVYSRRFTQTSGIGTARGWETIVLPFDVNKFTYTGYNSDSGENIALAPFGSEALQTEGTRPFWLYEMTTEGPQRATTLKAHTPYLICMPNNGKYPNSSNIYGNVNFIGEDETNGVLISETEGKLTTAQGQEYNLVPTYETVPKSESVYALNIGSWYDEHQEGSVFIKNYQDVNPFYAYAIPTSTASAAKAPKYFSIGGGGATGIEEQLLMTPEQLTRVYSTDGIIYIHCSKAQIISIYDVNGRTVYTLKATEGDNEVHTLPDGTYFLEGQKVIVKH